MMVPTGNLPADERALLEQAENCPRFASLSDLTESVLLQLTRSHGVDFATALLFNRLVRSTRHADFVQRVAALMDKPQVALDLNPLTVAVAPGAFYAEYPHTGAGGDVILRDAARLGCRTELIPVDSVGTAEQNGRLICRWLASRTDERIVLVSLSKGGTDVKLALAQPAADDAFRNVMTWINIGGILDGSPMVSWILARRLSTLIYRSVFWWLGYDFQFATSLDRRTGGALDFQLRLPRRMDVIHVVGFPLRKHMSSRRARRWHRRLSSFGPNEGVTLLADLLRQPGHVLPVWGTDHYLQDRWQADALVGILLRLVGEECRVCESSASTP